MQAKGGRAAARLGAIGAARREQQHLRLHLEQGGQFVNRAVGDDAVGAVPHAGGAVALFHANLAQIAPVRWEWARNRTATTRPPFSTGPARHFDAEGVGAAAMPPSCRPFRTPSSPSNIRSRSEAHAPHPCPRPPFARSGDPPNRRQHRMPVPAPAANPKAQPPAHMRYPQARAAKTASCVTRRPSPRHAACSRPASIPAEAAARPRMRDSAVRTGGGASRGRRCSVPACRRTCRNGCTGSTCYSVTSP